MTAKAALCQALLNGEVINIKNGFTKIGITNAPREISRMVEKDFNVIVSRTPQKGKNRYRGAVTWVDYRLNTTEYNKPGIKAMKEYVKSQINNNKK
jgi:hypothetical protein